MYWFHLTCWRMPLLGLLPALPATRLSIRCVCWRRPNNHLDRKEIYRILKLFRWFWRLTVGKVSLAGVWGREFTWTPCNPWYSLWSGEVLPRDGKRPRHNLSPIMQPQIIQGQRGNLQGKRKRFEITEQTPLNVALSGNCRELTNGNRKAVKSAQAGKYVEIAIELWILTGPGTAMLR